MKIKINVLVRGKSILEDTIEIEDAKLEPLEPSEIENAIEINVSSWINEQMRVEWDAEEE